MAVNAAPVARRARVRPVRLDRVLEQLHPPLRVRLRVVHARDPAVALLADDADRLRAALEELAHRRGLVRPPIALPPLRPEEARVRELDDHLRPPVGRHSKRLHRGLAVRRAHGVERLRPDEREGRVARALHRCLRLGPNGPVERHGERAARVRVEGRVRGGRERGRGDEVEHAVAHRRGRRAVHDRVLADEPGLAVCGDDELEGLVHPAVAEPELRARAVCLGHDRAVPEEARVRDEGGRGLGVEAEGEG